MNMDFIEIVNEFQKYTIGQITPQETYKIYYDFLPKQKQFNKYIKGKKTDEYNKELVEFISNHYMISNRESKQCIDFWKGVDKQGLIDILKRYGKTETEIKQWLK